VSARCVGYIRMTGRDPIRRCELVAVGGGFGPNTDEERGRGIGILFSLAHRTSG